jgi:hypothetical protein
VLGYALPSDLALSAIDCEFSLLALFGGYEPSAVRIAMLHALVAVPMTFIDVLLPVTVRDAMTLS